MDKTQATENDGIAEHSSLSYSSNDKFIWTNDNPDLELVEPRILVSINKNYLKFGRKVGRPPLSHQILLVNHGEHPVAFKVQTTDNYAYFVNQVYGVIPGRRFQGIPHARAPNTFQLIVFRRPYDTFMDEQQGNNFNIPRKERLFIHLAPIFSFTTPPATVFHSGASFEKLRVCLDYTGQPVHPDDVAVIYRRAKGWCTWELGPKTKSDQPGVDKIVPVPKCRPRSRDINAGYDQTEMNTGVIEPGNQ